MNYYVLGFCLFSPSPGIQPSPASPEIISGNFTPEPDSQEADIGSLSSKYSLDRRREDERK